MNEYIDSPLTGNRKAYHYLTIPVKDVIAEYKKQFSIDVSQYFVGHSNIYIYKCSDTGYKFYYPDKFAGNGEFYERLYFSKAAENESKTWKYEFQIAYDLLNKNDYVLDVGCNDGLFLNRARDKTENGYGLELNENSCYRCRNLGLKVSTEMVEDHALNYQSRYDVITAFQVLEHVYNVHQFLNSIVHLLKPGGKLVLGTPNNEPFFLGYDVYAPLNMPPHHMGLWNAKVFRELEKLFPLQLLDVKYSNKGSFLAHAYYHAKYIAGIKGLKHEHGLKEWLVIGLTGLITVPYSFFKKLFSGIHGNFITVVFRKK